MTPILTRSAWQERRYERQRVRRIRWRLAALAGGLVFWLLVIVAIANAEWSTSYSPCSAGTIMADGTHVRPGSAAMNSVPLGTRIWIHPAQHGRHRWTVRDRYGYGTQLDLWTGSCAAASRYGRRWVRVTVGWRHAPSHGLLVGKTLLVTSGFGWPR